MKIPALVCVVALACAAPAWAQSYDLNADWKDGPGDNPNADWTYREGIFALPRVANWLPLTQPAWANPNNKIGNKPGEGFLPGWAKVHNAFLDVKKDDVVVHSTDPHNGAGMGPANVIWTSPSDGEIDISGHAWTVDHDIGRSSKWTILHHPISAASYTLTSGTLPGGGVFNRGEPYHFDEGTKGSSVLRQVQVMAGDILELRVEANPPKDGGTFVGVNLAITLRAPVLALIGQLESMIRSGLPNTRTFVMNSLDRTLEAVRFFHVRDRPLNAFRSVNRLIGVIERARDHAFLDPGGPTAGNLLRVAQHLRAAIIAAAGVPTPVIPPRGRGQSGR